MANKLELTWYGKDEPIRVEPRLLIENTELSNTAADPETQNMLIHGDNLLALKALESKFAGQVKCIYIDPPYNTGSAFEHYDDNLEHSIWLNLMRPRLEILWNLLDGTVGSLWISIDDSEQAYMRVLCDELFGRHNFVAQNVWQKRYSRENREAIGDAHEYIIVYAKNPARFKESRNLVAMSEEQAKVYKNPNNDPKGRWRGVPMTAQGYRPNQMYPITDPKGNIHYPPEGRCWSTVESEFKKLLEQGRIYFGKNNDSQPSTIRYLSEVPGVVPWTWWPCEEVGHTDSSKKEIMAIFGKDNIFATPKPEELIQRIIHIASNPGDLVLDSFLGSGTTAAVAQKMGRRWIGVEMGNHAYTHCKVRIVLTTAEDIVAVVDAVIAKGSEAAKDFIAEFTGIATDDQVLKALQMACELQLIVFDSSRGCYGSPSFLARKLVSASSDEQKAVFMRLILEQYAPYNTFKTRYGFTKSIELACRQTKTLHMMTSNERDVKNTLISIATYAKALKSEGANLYSFVEDVDAVGIIEAALRSANITENSLRTYWGENLYTFVNTSNVFAPLIEALQKTHSGTMDVRSIVVCAANAFESFLADFAVRKGVSLSGRNGILQKRDALSAHISKKHRGMIEFVGQVRNAADHGADPDENNQVWTISNETARIYPCIIAALIKAIFSRDATGSIEV